MAAVTSRAQQIGKPIAIIGIIAVTLLFLSPIYWISSTAFKPRAVATSVPPTVVFQPEVTPFIKLFTKRSALRQQPTPEEFAAAPWWEQAVLSTGERILRVGEDVQLSQYPNRFANSLIVSIISTVLAVGMGTITAYGFSRFKIKGEQDLLFFILSTRMLPPVVVAIPMFLMYRSFDLNDTHLGSSSYTAFNVVLGGLMKGSSTKFRRSTRRRRSSMATRVCKPSSRWYCRRLPRASPRRSCVLLHHRVERICLRADVTNRRAQTAPPFIQADGVRPAGVDGDRGRHEYSISCSVAIFTFLLRETICCVA